MWPLVKDKMQHIGLQIWVNTGEQRRGFALWQVTQNEAECMDGQTGFVHARAHTGGAKQSI